MSEQFPITILVAPADAGQRLDQFLVARLDVSRARVQQLIAQEKVLVNEAAAQIACRYVFAIPIIWSEETMRYAMVWTVFLAGSTLVLRNEHLATGWEPRNRRVRQGLGIVRFLLIGGFGALLSQE